MKKQNLTVMTFLMIIFVLLSSCMSASNADPFKSGEIDSEGQRFMLNISADIDNAHIYVNGNFMGNKSISTHFRSGTYRIEVKSAGYRTWKQDITLDTSRTLVAQMAVLPGLE